HGVSPFRIQGRAHRVLVVNRSVGEGGLHCLAAETQRRTAGTEEFAARGSRSPAGKLFCAGVAAPEPDPARIRNEAMTQGRPAGQEMRPTRYNHLALPTPTASVALASSRDSPHS